MIQKQAEQEPPEVLKVEPKTIEQVLADIRELTESAQESAVVLGILRDNQDDILPTLRQLIAMLEQDPL